MKAEGTCPDCGSTLGVQIDDALAGAMSSTIKRVVDKDGNKMRCSACNAYKDPDNVTIEGD